MQKKESLHDLLVHDLGTPISIIEKDLKDILLREEKFGKLTSEQRKVLERALRNAKKAQTLLSEMVETLKSKEGYFDANFFSVEEALKAALIDVLDLYIPDTAERLLRSHSVEDFKKELESASIEISFHGKYISEKFYHDRKKVLLIMRNLFSNALKYRRESVRIRVFGDDDLFIEVEDDGPGIPDEKRDSIFRRFIHLGTKAEGSAQGMGFGLSCVKSMVESLNGEIRMDSELGKGTRFLVRIPPLR